MSELRQAVEDSLEKKEVIAEVKERKEEPNKEGVIGPGETVKF